MIATKLESTSRYYQAYCLAALIASVGLTSLLIENQFTPSLDFVFICFLITAANAMFHLFHTKSISVSLLAGFFWGVTMSPLFTYLTYVIKH